MKNIKKLFIYIIPFLILFVMFYFIGFNKIFSVLKQVKLGPLLVAIFLQILLIIISAIRWRELFKRSDSPKVPSLKNTIYTILIGNFVNNITPSMRGGGEPVRAYYLSKLEKIKEGFTMSLVFIERILDTTIFLFFLLFIIGYLSIFDPKLAKYLIYAWFILLLLTGFAVYIIVINKKLLKKIVYFIYEVLSKFKKIDKEKIDNFIDDFHEKSKILFEFFKKEKRVDLYIVLFLTILWYIIDIYKYKFFFKALNYNISFWKAGVIYLLTLLSGTLSFTPSGLGFSDLIMILISNFLGISLDVAAAVVILDRVISYGLLTIIGYYTLLYIKKKYK